MKVILVGLDGSPHAGAVLTGACELAEKVGARLLLVHAVSLPVGVPPNAYAVSPSELAETLLQSARKDLEVHASQLPPALLAGVRVQYGVPWQALCEVAKAENVDLIAIGSHGYGGLDRLLGTTAAKVVNHADRSVLVVRAVGLLDELLGKS